MHVKDEIARRYLELFREEIAAGKTNANTPWLDLDVEAYRAYSRGERETLPGPTYTDGPYDLLDRLRAYKVRPHWIPT
jgi:hypothetical protein